MMYYYTSVYYIDRLNLRNGQTFPAIMKNFDEQEHESTS